MTVEQAKCTCTLKYCTSCQSQKTKTASDAFARCSSRPDKNRATFLQRCGYTHIKLGDGSEFSLQVIIDADESPTNIDEQMTMELD